MSGQGTHVYTLMDLKEVQEAQEAREKQAKEAQEAQEAKEAKEAQGPNIGIHGDKQPKAQTSASMATTTTQQDESIPEDMVIDPSKPIDTVQDRNQQVPGTGTQHPAPPTQNIQGHHGNQANNSGKQLRSKITFSRTTPAPAPAPMPTTAPAPAPAPALEHTSGTQNIQSNYGEQANNSGNQDDCTVDFGTETPANNSGTETPANNSGT